ncbi:hypothetical protein J2T57_002436 [Natronocella acetinitrilica]|uniref:Translation initiation factor IF-2 n=1 Tax=Natronocella acetinitrilica TaxID=414046 RepID=A0AAE3KCQ5_9GAMM|nr:hypothetical protein [Natronocella acetinitrilica]MCP1675288.1 hypothetical protein [Natronocella acetinitrilica]
MRATRTTLVAFGLALLPGAALAQTAIDDEAPAGEIQPQEEPPPGLEESTAPAGGQPDAAPGQSSPQAPAGQQTPGGAAIGGPAQGGAAQPGQAPQGEAAPDRPPGPESAPQAPASPGQQAVPAQPREAPVQGGAGPGSSGEPRGLRSGQDPFSPESRMQTPSEREPMQQGGQQAPPQPGMGQPGAGQPAPGSGPAGAGPQGGQPADDAGAPAVPQF